MSFMETALTSNRPNGHYSGEQIRAVERAARDAERTRARRLAWAGWLAAGVVGLAIGVLAVAKGYAATTVAAATLATALVVLARHRVTVKR